MIYIYSLRMRTDGDTFININMMLIIKIIRKRFFYQKR